MKKILPESWMPSDGIDLEEAADRAVRFDSHVLVIAGPGAGKTELLAQKAAYLFQTNICKDPRKNLSISFKTDAAQNLRDRVEKRCGNDIKFRFSSMTYDAFTKSILDHFLFALPESLRPSPDYLVNDYDVVDAAFKKARYQATLASNLLRDFARQNFFLNRKLRIMSQKRLRDRVKVYLRGQGVAPDGVICVPFSRSEWAEFMGVNRSALSRELSNMQAEGILEIVGKDVRILDKSFLQR